MSTIFISGIRGVRPFHGLVSPLVHYDEDDGECMEHIFEANFYPEPDGKFKGERELYIYEDRITNALFRDRGHIEPWFWYLKTLVKEVREKTNFGSESDFSELLALSANCFGPLITRKLAADFAKWDDVAKEVWGVKTTYPTYRDMKECFEYAAGDSRGNGVVGLRSFVYTPKRTLPRLPAHNVYGDENLI